jgi:hypothetical protein
MARHEQVRKVSRRIYLCGLSRSLPLREAGGTLNHLKNQFIVRNSKLLVLINDRLN